MVSSDETTTAAATPPSPTATSGNSDSTSDSSTGPGDDDSGMTGVSFLPLPDAGTEDTSCDLFTQDCPPGQKCMPWADDGSQAWNATRCSPIAKDPAAPGEPCTVEGGPYSGFDDCQLGTLCHDVDPKTLEGTCLALCTGTETDPSCEDPQSFCDYGSGGAVALCFPMCHPLEDDCAEGEGCYPLNNTWMCLATDTMGNSGAAGAPCMFIDACLPGLMCAGSASVPDCESPGCCTELCDLDDPQCSLEGVSCQAWFEPGEAPPGYENVGACVLPN